MIASSYTLYFSQPWWLAAALLLVPVVWLGRRHMSALGPVRRWTAIVLRCAVVLILVLLLARLMVARKNEQLTLISVIDRSQSIPQEQAEKALLFLEEKLQAENPGGLENNPSRDRLAVVDIAEAPSISALSSSKMEIRERNTSLVGTQSRLSDGIQMAMAIAPPDSATRILLLSDGNETSGDLKETARIAATNGIPIDVLPVEYQYEREVVFKRIAAPARARSGQTVGLRFILNSTKATTGRLNLSLNGKPVDLNPDSDAIGAAIELQEGTNVKTVSLPVGTRGMHEFEAVFVPDDPAEDVVAANNRATAMTFVAGPGHVIVVDTDGATGPPMADVLRSGDIDVRYVPIDQFPDDLAYLMDSDAIILSNVDAGSFTFEQQEMLTRYVMDLGGGLVMIGGPQSFGAGGWIGSPVAEVLPVDCDPPQKKQMPKGALVLIMHACEMPNGNMWGKKVGIAAVNTLSAQDLAGVLDYGWQGGSFNWVYPLSEVGDKSKITSAIRGMTMGDMPDFGSHMQAAYNALLNVQAGAKHVIIISDGDPALPPLTLLNQYKAAGITATGVAVFPHSPKDVQSLASVAQVTGGRFYNVSNPAQLPQIFIKEAQVVRRALILEETFTPILQYSLSEVARGLTAVPPLDGYVLTGPKGGFSQIVLVSEQGDPILATSQAGLGRCVAFTSSVDSRWAAHWLAWGGFESFWEQVVRWVGKPSQATDAEMFVDAQGRDISVTVEAVDPEGRPIRFSHIDAQIIGPNMDSQILPLSQTGSGQYQGRFQAQEAGSYIVNLRYRKIGEDTQTNLMQTPVTVPFAPEFRDLQDNRPLLEQVAALSGGRVLNFDPQVDLFDYSGLKFPETQLPITRWLLVFWVALFLLDVAVRRVAVDFAAVGRKAASWIRHGRKKVESDATLDALKQRRQKVQEQFKQRAGVRYEGGQKAPDKDVRIPQADVSKPVEPRSPEGPSKKTDKTGQEESHIQHLLRAKRGAMRQDKPKPDDQ
ncbi:MAG: VWA domain-containing protein [Sedimentisphaerales bacterium]|nr:VWA domain-containing protein [Sedimentisphaerales bacterium]